MPALKSQIARRSSRIPIQMPIHVTSLDPHADFSEACETVVVNAHGCSFRFPVKLKVGSALNLHTREGRETKAYVVECKPNGDERDTWTLGARLEKPDNIWGLSSYPDDWRVLEMPPGLQRESQSTFVSSSIQKTSRPAQAILEKVEEQLSEERLRGILAKLVQPMQSEINELHEKIARNARQNRFEVSLGQIPAELEEKLWERLHKNLGEKVLQQTKEQSAEILSTTKAATEQKIGGALTEFRHRLSGELHAVEQKAQALSKELGAMTRQQIQSGIEKLQQQTLDAGAQLSTHGEKVATTLERRLMETHETHRRDVEQVQAESSARASQLQREVSILSHTIDALNESVRHLEADLDSHLEHIATEIIADARAQFGAAVAQNLKDLQLKGASEVEARLDQVCSNLRTIQNRIETSFSGSLKAQSEEAAESANQRYEVLAQASVDRWRRALAQNLSAVASSLGQQLQKDLET